MFHFKSLFFSLLFAIGLVVLWRMLDANLIPAFFLIALGIVVLAFFAVRTVGHRLLFIPLPILLTIAVVLLFYFVDQSQQRVIFILGSTGVFYLTLISTMRMQQFLGDKTARDFYVASSMLTVFFALAAFYGFYLNFTQIQHPFGIPITITLSPWLLMAVFFILTFLVSYIYFYIISSDKRRSSLYAAVIGLAIAEIGWVVTFWPFRYLTTAVIVLMFYYVLWDLAQSYFLQILSRRRVVYNVVFFVLVTGLMLLSAQWDIIV